MNKTRRVKHWRKGEKDIFLFWYYQSLLDCHSPFAIALTKVCYSNYFSFYLMFFFFWSRILASSMAINQNKNCTRQCQTGKEELLQLGREVWTQFFWNEGQKGFWGLWQASGKVLEDFRRSLTSGIYPAHCSYFWICKDLFLLFSLMITFQRSGSMVLEKDLTGL